MIIVPYAASLYRSETFGFAKTKAAQIMIVMFITIITITRFLVVAHI
jgi:hypothetical protein